MAKRRAVDFFGLGAFKKNALGYEVFSKDHITALLSGGGTRWNCHIELAFPLRSRVRGLKKHNMRKLYIADATGTSRQRAVHNLATPEFVRVLYKLRAEWMLEFDRIMSEVKKC